MSINPISSNWFRYSMLTSLVKAYNHSEMSRTDNEITHGNSSFFSTLLANVMVNESTSMVSNFPLLDNQLVSQFSIVKNSINLKRNPVERNLNYTFNNFDFKPIQFIKLENNLKGKLVGTGTHFINAGKKYNIDPALLAAIAIHETGNGTSKAVHEKLNVAGMMGNNGLRSYSSLEESIFDMARNLRENYLNQGRNSIAAIGEKYAPIGAANDPTGLNKYWVDRVTGYYNDLT